MPQPRQTGRGQVNRHTHPQRSLWKRIYVSVLLALLPLLVKITVAISRKAKSETAFIGSDFALLLVISGFPRKRAMLCTGTSWKGLNASAEPSLTITFRDLDYAYDIFSGAASLQDGLAARLFTTHGPNDKAVAVTYLFTIILKAFFGWRSAYRR